MSDVVEEPDRPPIWAGHIGPLAVDDLDASVAFYRRLGLRPAAMTETLVSMELRGGTHLVLKPADGTVEPVDAPFDLMTDDLEGRRMASRQWRLRRHRDRTLGQPPSVHRHRPHWPSNPDPRQSRRRRGLTRRYPFIGPAGARWRQLPQRGFAPSGSIDRKLNK